MTTKPTSYFDLHTTGIGYVNRLREVTPKKGSSFTACTISAMRGESNAVEYTYIDVRVYNQDAANLLWQYKDALDNKQRVTISFRIGDLYAETFEYKNGERKGEIGISLKGRLIAITSISVNGENVYRTIYTPTSELPKANVVSHDTNISISAGCIESTINASSKPLNAVA
ncbi:DUF3577 domain-containing protein [Yersinia enterocolitica]|uniref:DUF3577 domain-containing protein n=2 Tax=Enterobacterales TaxID=91347 RepID=UPI001CFD3688|nr:DUF3577 domain-containing protein [Yersinia massiliensis]MCB5308771.1 DUF3577 domain-containing protein [Yersinia massiliensis]